MPKTKTTTKKKLFPRLWFYTALVLVLVAASWLYLRAKNQLATIAQIDTASTGLKPLTTENGCISNLQKISFENECSPGSFSSAIYTCSSGESSRRGSSTSCYDHRELIADINRACGYTCPTTPPTPTASTPARSPLPTEKSSPTPTPVPVRTPAPPPTTGGTVDPGTETITVEQPNPNRSPSPTTPPGCYYEEKFCFNKLIGSSCPERFICPTPTPTPVPVRTPAPPPTTGGTVDPNTETTTVVPVLPSSSPTNIEVPAPRRRSFSACYQACRRDQGRFLSCIRRCLR